MRVEGAEHRLLCEEARVLFDDLLSIGGSKGRTASCVGLREAGGPGTRLESVADRAWVRRDALVDAADHERHRILHLHFLILLVALVAEDSALDDLASLLHDGLVDFDQASVVVS